MVQRIHSPEIVLALLMVAVTVTLGTGASRLAQAATEAATEGPAALVQTREKANEILQQANDDKNRRKIRQENDRTSKAQEPLYPRQAGLLARHYRETAAIVAREGGDPQPLLDAAAYFELQSER